MSKTIYEVCNVEDNNLFDNNDLLFAMVLNFSNPLISIPFLKKNGCNNEKIDGLAKMTKIKYENEKLFYDDEEINDDFIKGFIIEDLCSIVEEGFKRDSENSLSNANVVKNIFEHDILSISKPQDNIVSVNDLMAKLYGNEEKGKVL